MAASLHVPFSRRLVIPQLHCRPVRQRRYMEDSDLYALVQEDTHRFSKPALIDNRHPSRFWLWQAGRLDFNQHQALSITSRGVVGLGYDSFGPFRVVRKLPPAGFNLLTNNLLKGFYDINAKHIGHLCNPIRTPYTLLLERIEACIEYANEITAGSSLPDGAGGDIQL